MIIRFRNLHRGRDRSSQVDDAVDSENENQTTDVQDGNTEKETKTDPSDDGQNEGEQSGDLKEDGQQTGDGQEGTWPGGIPEITLDPMAFPV